MGARTRSRRAGGARPPDGQHFLRSLRVATELVFDARVGPDDHVLEIGAGTGRLTAALVPRAGRVTALELDPDHAERLRREFQSDADVEVIEGDVLRVPFPHTSYRAFGNIPFGITTALLRRLLDDPASPLERVDLIVQCEVARKRASVWPSTLLSLGWFPWWELAMTRRVSRGAFEPWPSVDAAVLRITRREPALLEALSRPAYVRVLRSTFNRASQPIRRTLRDGLPPMTWKRLARDRGLPVDAIRRELDVFDWVDLFHTLAGGRW